MKIEIIKSDVEGKKLIKMNVNGMPFREAIKSGSIKGYEILGLIEMVKSDLLIFMKEGE